MMAPAGLDGAANPSRLLLVDLAELVPAWRLEEARCRLAPYCITDWTDPALPHREARTCPNARDGLRQLAERTAEDRLGPAVGALAELVVDPVWSRGFVMQFREERRDGRSPYERGKAAAEAEALSFPTPEDLEHHPASDPLRNPLLDEETPAQFRSRRGDPMTPSALHDAQRRLRQLVKEGRADNAEHAELLRRCERHRQAREDAAYALGAVDGIFDLAAEESRLRERGTHWEIARAERALDLAQRVSHNVRIERRDRFDPGVFAEQCQELKDIFDRAKIEAAAALARLEAGGYRLPKKLARLDDDGTTILGWKDLKLEQRDGKAGRNAKALSRVVGRLADYWEIGESTPEVREQLALALKGLFAPDLLTVAPGGKLDKALSNHLIRYVSRSEKARRLARSQFEAGGGNP